MDLAGGADLSRHTQPETFARVVALVAAEPQLETSAVRARFGVAENLVRRARRAAGVLPPREIDAMTRRDAGKAAGRVAWGRR